MSVKASASVYASDGHHVTYIISCESSVMQTTSKRFFLYFTLSPLPLPLHISLSGKVRHVLYVDWCHSLSLNADSAFALFELQLRQAVHL